MAQFSAFTLPIRTKLSAEFRFKQLMAAGFRQLGKLRRFGGREMRVRLQQELTKLSERYRVQPATEMSDSGLLREMAPASRNGTGEGTAGLILARLRVCASPFTLVADEWAFLPVLRHREEVVKTMERRFAAERAAILERAGRACAGRFDLLGHRDLSFGKPVDWHLDPRSGKRAPLRHWSRIDPVAPLGDGDPKIVWELNRHAHFITLGQAYWLTNDERYVAEFITQASAWMKANPPGMGINWASSLEVAFRAIAWLWALHLCASSPLMTNDFMARLLKQLIAHGRHLESFLSYYFSPNTHLTGEALGLMYLGVALPELRRAEAWRRKGLSILVEQLPKQVRADGVYFEQASYYHRYTVDFYTHMSLLVREGEAHLLRETGERLAQAFDHLMWITRPDGSSPLIGDDDGGRLVTLATRAANDFRDTLATGAALFGRGDWKWVAGEAAVETLWLLGPRGLNDYDRLPAKSPEKQEWAFSESGYFVMRDGWDRDSNYVFFDCGLHGAPIGCGHAHADALSFEFAAEGVTWLVDPGTYVYAADRRARDAFRTTLAHNTATVDGQPQSQPAGPFSWSSAAKCALVLRHANERAACVEGWHDGYCRLADPVMHRRAVMLVKADPQRGLPAYLVVRDLFAADGSHRYGIHYHFASGHRAKAEAGRIYTVDASGKALVLAAFGTAELTARVPEGWVSRCYGHREPSAVGVFEAEGKGHQAFVTVIVPFNSDSPEQSSAVERHIFSEWQTKGFQNYSQEFLFQSF